MRVLLVRLEVVATVVVVGGAAGGIGLITSIPSLISSSS